MALPVMIKQTIKNGEAWVFTAVCHSY